MGEPLTEFDRGTGAKGLLPPYFDQRKVGYEISGILVANDDAERKDAYEAAHLGVDLLTRLGDWTWASDRKRRLYTKYFLIAYWTLLGRSPTNYQLHFMLMDVEKEYFDLLVKRRKEEETAREKASQTAAVTREKARQAAVLAAARWQVRLRAASFAMNPTTDFEPRRYIFDLTTARRTVGWVEDDIVDYKPKVDKAAGTQALVLTYKDGATLEIPLHPVTVMHTKPLPSHTNLPFFRLHKASRRLIPFQIDDEEFKRLASAVVPVEELMLTVPPRFDPDLTPRILRLRNIVHLDRLAVQFDAARQAFSALSAGTGVTALKPQNILAGGIDDAAVITVNTAKATATVARTLAQEIHATVVSYGVSRAAAAFLGKSAWSWYCRNAIVVNVTAITAAEIGFTLTGNDPGPNVGDGVVFAANRGKDGHKAYRMTVESVGDVPNVGKLVKGKVADPQDITPQKFANQFDSGKLIHHDRVVSTKTATVADKRATAKIAAKKPVVVDDAKLAAANNRANTKRAVDDPATKARLQKSDTKIAAKPKVKADPPTKPPVPTKKSPRIDDPHGMRQDLDNFDRQTAGTGGIDSIAFLKDPEGRYSVKIKGRLQANTLYRGRGDPPAGKVKAPNYNRSPKFVSNKQAGLDDNWENAHLWGPGFGDEAAAGMMKAPKSVNQWDQNEGAEGWMRALHKEASARGGTVDVEATAIAWDLVGKKWQPKTQVDFLKHVEYRVMLNLPGKPPQSIRITIDCGTPPSLKSVRKIRPPNAALPSNLF